MDVKIVHCKKAPFDVYIGRPSKWGNPFVIGMDGTRAEVISKFEQYIKRKPELLASISELKDKTLGCWCDFPKQDCHGRILAELANKITSEIMSNLKLAVIGSRNFFDYSFLCKEIDKLKPSLLVSGGAAGADELANRYAKDFGLPILIYYPRWQDGKAAGFTRNTKIIEACDMVLAFQVNKSKGTQDSLDKAAKLGKKIVLHEIKSDLTFF